MSQARSMLRTDEVAAAIDGAEEVDDPLEGRC